MKTAILTALDAEPLWTGDCPAVLTGELVMVPDGDRHVRYAIGVRMVVVHGEEPAQYLVIIGKGTPVEWA